MAMPATCLCFSDSTGLAEFLNAGGNAALLDGPLVRVGNLQMPGDPDARMSVCAVFVGLARLLRDFRGVRKHPNVILRANPNIGPNDGFLEVIVRTHNGCGIAAGSEIVADLGENYVPASVPATSAAKRFKGSLDIFFEKQMKRTEEEPPRTEEEAPTPSKGNTGSSPAKTGSNPAETGSNPGNTGSAPGAAGSSTDRPGPSGAGGSSGDGGHASSGAASGTGAPTGDQVLGSPANHSDVQLVLLKSTGALVARKEGSKKVVKIPAKTVLSTYNQGGVVEVKDSEHMEFSFKKGSELVIDSSKMQVTTLANMIKEHGVTQLFAHAPFAKGACPTAFAVKKKMGFVPKEREAFARLRKAIQGATKSSMLWVVQIKEGKIVPKSLALVSTKAITVKDSDEPM